MCVKFCKNCCRKDYFTCSIINIGICKQLVMSQSKCMKDLIYWFPPIPGVLDHWGLQKYQQRSKQKNFGKENKERNLLFTANLN